jgi:hypothetical protein
MQVVFYFWLFLCLAFLSMAVFGYEIRRELPKHIKEAMDAARFVGASACALSRSLVRISTQWKMFFISMPPCLV